MDVEVMHGAWRNRACGRVVRDPEVINGIVFVHVHTWGWFGNKDYFLAEFTRIEEGCDDHQQRCI